VALLRLCCRPRSRLRQATRASASRCCGCSEGVDADSRATPMDAVCASTHPGARERAGCLHLARDSRHTTTSHTPYARTSGTPHFGHTATDLPVPRSPMMSTPPTVGSITLSISASFMSSWSARRTNGSAGILLPFAAAGRCATAVLARVTAAPRRRCAQHALPRLRAAGLSASRVRRCAPGTCEASAAHGACSVRPPAGMPIGGGLSAKHWSVALACSYLRVGGAQPGSESSWYLETSLWAVH